MTENVSGSSAEATFTSFVANARRIRANLVPQARLVLAVDFRAPVPSDALA